ncbi:Restriction endonuclease subunit S [Moraxellaceae bacterium 17A]|nr:Restriction endonuclease subunit S [Moraxellaceae bacterium 17A]
MSYATYERYKESGVDWLGEIPSDWELLKVKNIFRLVMKFAPKNNDCELLSVYTDIGVKPRKELEERGNRATTTDGYLIVEKGDIVVNKLLAWMGAIGLSDYDGVTSPAYDILKPKIPIEGIFYHLLFRSPQCTSELRRYSRGIMDMRLRLYFDKFGDVVVPYPNIEVQKKIVSFLAKKTTQIDQAIALKQQQIEKLNEYQQIVIQNAVTKGLDPNAPMKNSGVEWIGDIPEHWDVKKLKYVLKSYNKKISSRNSDLRYLGMENIISKTGEINNESAEVEGLANHFKPNHILFGKLRPYLAKVYLADFEGICSTEFLVFEVLEPNNAKFLQILLLSNGFIQNIDSSTYGSKMPRANPDFINNQFIAIPPLDEQLQIINAIENKNQPIKQAIEKYQIQIDRLKEYKNILINQAVTGKIKI